MQTESSNTATSPVFKNVDELAAYIGLARSTTYAAIKAGEIPALRVGKKRFVISRHAVNRWLESSGQRAVA